MFLIKNAAESEETWLKLLNEINKQRKRSLNGIGDKDKKLKMRE